MTNQERERLEEELRVIWEKCLQARDAGQEGMEAISKLKAKLISEQLAELKADAKKRGVEL